MLQRHMIYVPGSGGHDRQDEIPNHRTLAPLISPTTCI